MIRQPFCSMSMCPASGCRLAAVWAIAFGLLGAGRARAEMIWVHQPVFEVVRPSGSGTVTPTDLSPYLSATADGFRLSGLTLTYTASPLDNNQDISVTLFDIRQFTVDQPTPNTLTSHLDGSVSYSSAFTLTDISLQTNTTLSPQFGAVATAHTNSIASGGAFDVSATGSPYVELPFAGAATFLEQELTISFHQGTATAGDTLTLTLPGSAASQATGAAAVPEPSSIVLLTLGLAGVWLRWRGGMLTSS